MNGLLLILTIGSIEFFHNIYINQFTLQFIFLLVALHGYLIINSNKIYVDKILKFGILYVFAGLMSFLLAGRDVYMLAVVVLTLCNGLLIYFIIIQQTRRMEINRFYLTLRLIFYIGSFVGIISELLAGYGINLPVNWAYGFCMVLFPLVYYSLRNKGVGKSGIFLRVLPFLMLIFITSWRAFSLMSIIGVLYAINRKYGYLKIFGMAVVGLAFVSLVLISSNKSAQTDPSSGRLFLWIKTVDLISNKNFLGAGFGQLSSYYYEGLDYVSTVQIGTVVSEAPGQSKERIHAHNSILQVLFDAGVLGLIIYLKILFLMYIKINKLIENYFLSKNLKISLILLLLTSLLSSFGGIYSISFWMLSAVITSVVRLELNAR